MVEEMGLHSRVRLLGRVDRRIVAEWCQMADRFVLASGYEGFAHVVVEAASSGLPCFVSDQAGNPEAKELFPEYVTTVPYKDKAAWMEALQKPAPRLPPMAPRPFEEVVMKTKELMKRVCTS
jgi:glycosyltransferase involved in cell wall biosynthesis